MSDALARLYRRLIMAVGRGRTTVVNDAGRVQTLQIRLGADEVVDAMPRLAEYGLASNPPAGSDAVAVFLAGERSNGVVIACGNQTYRMTGLASGEVAIHNNVGQSVLLAEGGMTINGGGQAITITNTPTVQVNAANLLVTGDIKDHSASSVDTIEGIRVKFNTHTHTGAHAPFPDPQLPV